MNLKSEWIGHFAIQLTVLRSSHLGKDPERSRLQISRTATPVFRLIFRLVLGFKHSLVHWRGTVYMRIFNRKGTAIQRVKRCETAHGTFHPNLSLVLQLFIPSNSNPKHSFENTTNTTSSSSSFFKQRHRSVLRDLRMVSLILVLEWLLSLFKSACSKLWKS